MSSIQEEAENMIGMLSNGLWDGTLDAVSRAVERDFQVSRQQVQAMFAYIHGIMKGSKK